MKNRMQDVSKMFDVELGEEFDIKTVTSDDIYNPYKFSIYGVIDKQGYERDGILTNLLTGEIELIKKPWKLKNGDSYYYKDGDGTIHGTSFCEECSLDLANYYIGNRFKTREEAEEFDIQFLKNFYDNGGEK